MVNISLAKEGEKKGLIFSLCLSKEAKNSHAEEIFTTFIAKKGQVNGGKGGQIGFFWHTLISSLFSRCKDKMGQKNVNELIGKSTEASFAPSFFNDSIYKTCKNTTEERVQVCLYFIFFIRKRGRSLNKSFLIMISLCCHFN